MHVADACIVTGPVTYRHCFAAKDCLDAARLGMTLVVTSVADERAFSCMIFMKNNAETSFHQHSPLYAH
jgi:hypothetical protein